MTRSPCVCGPRRSEAIARVRRHVAERENPALDFHLWNATSNADAMSTLLGGFQNDDGPEDDRPRRRFLPEDGKPYPQVVKPKALPGVRAHVLGPSRDWDVIKRQEPKKTETYELLAAVATPGEQCPPFAACYRLDFDGPGPLARLAAERRWAKSEDPRAVIDRLSWQTPRPESCWNASPS